jgi:hypothetical protein
MLMRPGHATSLPADDLSCSPDAAIRKMLATLDDPFTRFLEPEKFRSLKVTSAYLPRMLKRCPVLNAVVTSFKVCTSVQGPSLLSCRLKFCLSSVCKVCSLSRMRASENKGVLCSGSKQ